MRSSGPTGGNSAKSSVSQPLLLGFSRIGGLLREGSAQFWSMVDHVSAKIVATEREGNNSSLRLNVKRTPSLTGTTPLPRSGHGAYLNWLRNVLLARGEINGISPHPVDCDHPGGRLPPIPAHKRSEGLGSRFRPLPEV